MFGGGASNYLTGAAAIEQNIRTKVLMWVGDCFYSMFSGVDWKNRLDVGQQDNLIQEIKQVVLASYGVTGVNSISGVFSSAARLETISLNISTIYSPSQQLTIPTQQVGV